MLTHKVVYPFFIQLYHNIHCYFMWKKIAKSDDLGKHIIKKFGFVGFLTLDLF